MSPRPYSDPITQKMVADINASRHFGLAAHERVRRDTKLAWLKTQRITDEDVRSMGGVIAYWNNPETFRQQRIIALMAARDHQLRDWPGSFAYWMNEAIRARRHEAELRTEQAPKPVSVTQVADMVCASIMASQRVA